MVSQFLQVSLYWVCDEPAGFCTDISLTVQPQCINVFMMRFTVYGNGFDPFLSAFLNSPCCNVEIISRKALQILLMEVKV